MERAEKNIIIARVTRWVGVALCLILLKVLKAKRKALLADSIPIIGSLVGSGSNSNGATFLGMSASGLSVVIKIIPVIIIAIFIATGMVKKYNKRRLRTMKTVEKAENKARIEEAKSAKTDGHMELF